MKIYNSSHQQILLAKGVTIRDPAGDRYSVESLLGRGVVGSVYLVRSRRFERSLFALKEVIDPDKRDRERFLFEGEVLKRLHHRALPRVYRLFEHEKLKRVYMLMDYVQGKNLETLRHEQPERRFPLALALALMAPIVDALTYLHQQDPPIVHRDVKPSNIIVPIRAEEAMLVDFGLAKEYFEEDTTSIVRHGSPGYAALEQYGSGTTPQTDIYSLGATLYALLTGTVPVDAVTRATGSKGADPLQLVSDIKPDIPEAIARTIQRAMSLSMKDRFDTVEEFWKQLKASAPESGPLAVSIPASFGAQPNNLFKQSSTTSPAKNQKNTPRLDKGKTRRRRLLPVALALLGVAVLVSGFLLYSQVLARHSSTPSSRHSTTTPTLVLVASPATGSPGVIVGSYQGTLLDLTTNSNTTLVLNGMQEKQGRISGYILFGPNGPKLQGKGLLSGTINADNQLQFIVTDAGGHPLFFFDGVMQSPTRLSGQFYSCNSVQGGECNQVPGSYGMWNVNQVA